jgi:hypothetical protein
VQHGSGFLSFNSDASGANVFLEEGANQARSSFVAPAGLLGTSFCTILFDQPVLQYFDTGSSPALATVTDFMSMAETAPWSLWRRAMTRTRPSKGV